jgi:hypothetical protein
MSPFGAKKRCHHMGSPDRSRKSQCVSHFRNVTIERGLKLASEEGHGPPHEPDEPPHQQSDALLSSSGAEKLVPLRFVNRLLAAAGAGNAQQGAVFADVRKLCAARGVFV